MDREGAEIFSQQENVILESESEVNNEEKTDTDDVAEVAAEAQNIEENIEAESEDEEAIQDTGADGDEIIKRLNGIEESIANLCESIEEHGRRDADTLVKYGSALGELKTSLAANQRHEDMIYAELQKAKSDERFTIIRPFLEFMVERHKDSSVTYKRYEADQADMEKRYTQEGYKLIIDEIKFQLALYEGELRRQGVEIRNYEHESEYDVRYHWFNGQVVITEDEDKVGKIAQVDSMCYVYDNEKVLSRAKVRLYKAE